MRKAEVDILYEDAALIAIDKPAGLPSVPVHRTATGASALTVVQAARKHAYVVHRIDRYTSGVLLFAKTSRDRDALIKQFLAHTPVREYLAVVRGRVAESEAPLVHHFRRDGMHQKLRDQSDPGAARAELRYTVERRLRGATLVRVSLVTGLQNQIRVQFSAIGHPVVGDRKYHPSEAQETRIDRVALHAARLEVVHPKTGTVVSIHSDLPGDFRALVRSLA